MAYSQKVLDHYSKPRNRGSLDKKDPNVGTGIVGAPECGDVMKLQIKINPDSGRIEDAKFMTYGCGSAIASSSLATEMMIGRNLDDAFAIRNDAIVEELSLPPVKIHCSVLAEDAIKAAVVDLAIKRMPDSVLSWFAADMNRFRFLMVDVRRECGSDIGAMVQTVEAAIQSTEAMLAGPLSAELSEALSADPALKVRALELLRRHKGDTAAALMALSDHVEAHRATDSDAAKPASDQTTTAAAPEPVTEHQALATAAH